MKAILGPRFLLANVLLLASLVGCGGGDGGAPGDVPTIACDYPNFVFFHYCAEAPGMPGAPNGCVQGGGKELSSCPRDGVVGTCAMMVGNLTYRTYFYGDAVTAEVVAEVCPGGKYTPGPPPRM
jgi:hypothetical protein